MIVVAMITSVIIFSVGVLVGAMLCVKGSRK
jgi:hypothetical protein